VKTASRDREIPLCIYSLFGSLLSLGLLRIENIVAGDLGRHQIPLSLL
jgi:hypothetical protein